MTRDRRRALTYLTWLAVLTFVLAIGIAGRAVPELITWSPPPGDDVTAVTVGRPWAAVSAPRAAVRRGHATRPQPRRAYPRLGQRPLHLAHGPCRCRRHCVGLGTHQPIHHRAPGRGDAALPHADRRRGPGPRWVCPAPWCGDFVSRAIILGSELGVITLKFGPSACRCAVCPAPVWPEEGVTVVIPTRPGGEVRHLGCTHRACAERYRLGPPDADGYR